LADARRFVTELPASYPKALQLLSIGSHYWLAQWRFGLGAEWRRQSYDAYRAGLEVARGIDNQRLISHALGSIGRLYGDEGRYSEALHYTRQAAFVAQEADAADVLYLWQWQAARLMRSQGEPVAAIEGYRNAIRTLRSVRSDVTSSGIASQTLVGSAFRELADLLLRQASNAADSAAAQRDLLEVRSTLEELRQAEVAEYFRDDGVVQTQGATQLDQVSKDAAVIYPVVLADRTELLVSLPGRLERFSVPIGLTELTAAVREFRQKLEVFDAVDGFLPHSRRLYDWLIRPMAVSLRQASVRTLVIVPDGPLRTIPLSALHDGSRFLIENYAVVTSPGLALTSAGAGSRARVQVLAGGLTQSVQGFSPLPNVSSELASVATAFETTRLQDGRFQKATVEREVAGGEYSIVHFATHGHFDNDHSRSFLVTFDGQITMDDLQATVGQRRYRAEAVELLVLSACQTAAGDDRAALGLAGVGSRAGARSVVASLWSISDESTSMLVAELYRRLQASDSTKAEALRAAQLSLLSQEKFRHPYFWAPFLLIGNWL
jgi:CHAT domain-containing protein